MLKLVINYCSRYFDESSVLNTGGKSSLNSTLRRVSTYFYGLDMALLVTICVPQDCYHTKSQLCTHRRLLVEALLGPGSCVFGILIPLFQGGCNSAGAFLHILSFWFPLTLKYQGTCQTAPSSRLCCSYQMKNHSSNTKELLCCVQEEPSCTLPSFLYAGLEPIQIFRLCLFSFFLFTIQTTRVFLEWNWTRNPLHSNRLNAEITQMLQQVPKHVLSVSHTINVAVLLYQNPLKDSLKAPW